ncbi:carboxypeptidase-like regulatory domain-containing protein [Larsenimonas rhizosphaerae]|uniref:Carboxypeptidase-like regulatory domain-containing protein n=1 Tax=Larsenimonas rhizosphaerae TaxID=2944682 RepID=A0AA41ZNA3_9GAMM|nr:carboxypeptidase-like regulatory domain-containing protein [Larsenimonas rhizosphaerae]MCM2129385.1 carboxypeptidase-like regulatory domain-containing protein [Larsenimonas rhizosphaerae]MCX2524040.1 carboxypeptidase-like regulatory domain-containing protein [Larsenimonas rhizosphaerae]
MRKILALPLFAVMLSGCQMMSESGILPDSTTSTPSQNPNLVKRTVPFSADEYARLEKTGTGTIKGQLYYSRNGQKITNEGETVSVAPATAYAAEAADAALAGKQIEPADPRAREYTHTARTDSTGHFTVTGIPAGVFYVGSAVHLPDGTLSPFILKQVRLSEGQTKTIDLSR